MLPSIRRIHGRGHTLERALKAIATFALLGALLLPGSAGGRRPDPEDNDSLRTALEERTPRVVAEGHAPATQVAVADKDGVLWSRAFGAGAGVHDAFMSASVQKTFTTTAVLQLASRGLVDLDADISDYLPFPVRHPAYPDRPITLRMMLSHRSGMGVLPLQFDWDTRCAFTPEFRPDCRFEVVDVPMEAFLRERLAPDGSEVSEEGWVFEPGQRYRYSQSAFPLMRYLVERVSGQSYPDYMEENVFGPLGMEDSAMGGPKDPTRRAQPYTRRNGVNVELPLWEGNGYLMQTTAEDMSRFIVAFLNQGRAQGFTLLEPESVALMEDPTTTFSGRVGGRDLAWLGHGMGLYQFGNGWLGYGGSAPGFLTLLRYNPGLKVGYVIMVNVNALHGGGDADMTSAQEEIYRLQDEVVAILEGEG